MTHRHNPVLYYANWVVDGAFCGDFFIQFNTAYFDEFAGSWVTSRRRIAAQYVKFWFWADLASLFPWERLPVPGGVSMLRLVRLVRLLKLARVAKAPRILARFRLLATMSFKMRVVLKYFLLLVCLLHLQSCVIRLAHDQQRGDSKNMETNSYLRWTVEDRGSSWRGNWASYVDALDWAVKTMLGESAYVTTAEGVLSVYSNLSGVLFIAFLFGDLTNILCNLDPASNEFKRTVDNLNLFASHQGFPIEVRDQLHEYLRESEVLFKWRFHHEIVKRVSPNLQELIAHFLLGHRVVRLPFVWYARQCALGLVCGRAVVVRGGGGALAPAVIVAIHGPSTYNVRYETGLVETCVGIDRISLDEEANHVKRNVGQIEFITKLFVTAVSHALELTLFMGGDHIVRKDVSVTDSMYVVDDGRVLVVGANVAFPWRIEFVGDGGSFGDRAVAANIGHSRGEQGANVRPPPSWYNARATVISRILILKSDDLVAILDRPGFETFRKYISRYGRWATLKMAFYKALRAGTAHTLADEPPHTPEEKTPDALEKRLTDMEERLEARVDAMEHRILACLSAHWHAAGHAAASDASAPAGEVCD